MSMMVLCPTCGNKRCPHATDHRHACTGSNEPGQVGSIYGPDAAAKEAPIRNPLSHPDYPALVEMARESAKDGD